MAIINYLPTGGTGGEEHLVFDEEVEYSIPAYFLSGTCTSYLLGAYYPECKYIGHHAFSLCSNLSSIYFPVCSYIGHYAFYSCKALQEVPFPSCTSISSYAFYSCSFSLASFPVCTSIGNSAFQYAKGYLYLGAYSKSSIYTIFGKTDASSAASQSYSGYIQISGIEIPSVRRLASYAFYGAPNLRTVKAETCSYIDQRAFIHCKNLELVSFPACTYVGSYAFYYANVSLAYFPVCTTFVQSAFMYTSGSLYLGAYSGSTIFYMFGKTERSSAAYYSYIQISAIEIPAVPQLDSCAFYSASKLQTVKAETCSYIGSSAFYSCQSLMSLYLLSNSVCTLGSYVFNYTPMSNSTYTGSYGSVFVPASLVNSYKTATNWTVYSARIAANN